MAWLIGDSFDFYGSFNDAILSGSVWASGIYAVSSTTRFGVGSSANFSSGQNLQSGTFSNSTTIYLNWALNVGGNLTSGSTVWWGLSLKDGGTNQVGIFLTSGGTFVVTSGAPGGTVLATSPFTIPNSGWTHLQFKVVINNTAGSVECRLNGNTSNDWTATSLNTRNGTANSFVNNLNILAQPGTNGNIWDDFYCFNDTGAAPNTWQGDIRAVQLMPSSDSAVTWTPSSGANNFSRVSELHNDGDTSYVSTNTANNVDQYGTTSLSTTPIAIIAVQTKGVVRMDDAGPHTVKLRLTSGGNTSDGSNLVLSTSYQWASLLNTLDPNGSIAWTGSAVNAATIGPVDVV